MAKTQRDEIYKCEECGHIMEVLQGGNHPVCCGQKMKLQDASTRSGSEEKHMPVVERTSNGYKVTVGSAVHGMDEAHYIQFIDLVADGIKYRKFLKPTDEAPIVEFFIPEAKDVVAKEYCNLHGYWDSSK